MEEWRLGSVGKLIPSLKSKLVRSSDSTDAEELCVYGRNIMMGYRNREDSTKKDLSEDGWLNTGDLVCMDQDGYHYIVGREKDLIITAGGEEYRPTDSSRTREGESPDHQSSSPSG